MIDDEISSVREESSEESSAEPEPETKTASIEEDRVEPSSAAETTAEVEESSIVEQDSISAAASIVTDGTEQDEATSAEVADSVDLAEVADSVDLAEVSDSVDVANADPANVPEQEASSKEGSLAGALAGVKDSVETTEPTEVKVKKEKTKAPEKTAAKKASDSEEETEEEEVPVLKELSEAQAKLPWYVVHTYSGFEHMVKASLEERIKINDLVERFGNILIPQETVVELVRGQKKTSTRKFLPGYIVVQMGLDDETWHFVCETPKVTGFVGNSRDPVPLSQAEISNLVQQMEGGGKKARPKVSFEEGDAVKVVDGPFADFNGTVDDVKPDKGKLRVLISIFGRNTPVELDFVQVEKA